MVLPVYGLADTAVRMSVTKWHSLFEVLKGYCFLYRTADIPVKTLGGDTFELMGCP